MKIIHTSDWHIGQNFYGYDRYEEHDAVLEKSSKYAVMKTPTRCSFRATCSMLPSHRHRLSGFSLKK